MSKPHNTDKYHGMNTTQLQSEIYKLDLLNRELLAALRPFADLLEFPDEFPDEFFDCRVSVDDIKAAVAAIAKTNT